MVNKMFVSNFRLTRTITLRATSGRYWNTQPSEILTTTPAVTSLILPNPVVVVIVVVVVVVDVTSHILT